MTLRQLIEDDYDPMHFRYLCLTAHYRSQLTFTSESMVHAKRSFEALRNRVNACRLEPGYCDALSEVSKLYQARFQKAIEDDLNTAVALALVWEMAKDHALPSAEKLTLLSEFDEILGFGMDAFEKPILPPEFMALVEERIAARAEKNWVKADALRDKLKMEGLEIKDTPNGCEWYWFYKD
jgi:cysteinyl-tRNA synthetase